MQLKGGITCISSGCKRTCSLFWWEDNGAADVPVSSGVGRSERAVGLRGFATWFAVFLQPRGELLTDWIKSGTDGNERGEEDGRQETCLGA